MPTPKSAAGLWFGQEGLITTFGSLRFIQSMAHPLSGLETKENLQTGQDGLAFTQKVTLLFGRTNEQPKILKPSFFFFSSVIIWGDANCRWRRGAGKCLSPAFFPHDAWAYLGQQVLPVPAQPWDEVTQHLVPNSLSNSLPR